jgi:thioredoxin reductase
MLDAVIIGGGAAGLTAALYLGRFRRRVVVVDTGKQANRVSHAAHGFFTRDGTAPSELIRIGREQLRAYETVSLQSNEVIEISPNEKHFSITLDDGSSLTTRKVLLATGLKDTLPSVPGIEQFWGTSVFHCPYCDGWEMRDQPLAILDDGAHALHVAKLLRVLTADLVVCTNGGSLLTEAERAALDTYGVQVIDTLIRQLEGNDGQVEAIVFADGQRLPRKAIFTGITSAQHAPFASQLGCEMLSEHLVKIDELGRTSVAGVYAAGDLATRFRQVAMAVAQGASAASGINTDLIAEDFA